MNFYRLKVLCFVVQLSKFWCSYSSKSCLLQKAEIVGYFSHIATGCETRQQIKNSLFFPRLVCNKASFQLRQSWARGKFCFQLVQSETNSGMPLLCLYSPGYVRLVYFSSLLTFLSSSSPQNSELLCTPYPYNDMVKNHFTSTYSCICEL